MINPDKPTEKNRFFSTLNEQKKDRDFTPRQTKKPANLKVNSLGFLNGKPSNGQLTGYNATVLDNICEFDNSTESDSRIIQR